MLIDVDLLEEAVESQSHNSLMLRFRIEHRVGLACPRHAINEHCRIEACQDIADGLLHGAFEHLQVGGTLPEYLFVLEVAFELCRVVGRNDFDFFVAGDAE